MKVNIKKVLTVTIITSGTWYQWAKYCQTLMLTDFAPVGTIIYREYFDSFLVFRPNFFWKDFVIFIFWMLATLDFLNAVPYVQVDYLHSCLALSWPLVGTWLPIWEVRFSTRGHNVQPIVRSCDFSCLP